MADFSRITRLPPYIFSAMDQLKEEVKKTGLEIYDFGMGNPDQPTPPHIIETLNQAAKLPVHHRYSNPSGLIEMRQATSRWYQRRYGVDIDPNDEAVITLGSKEGLAHLALAVLNEESSVITQNPCYPVHQFGCIIADAKVYQIPFHSEDDFLTRLSVMIEAIHPRMLIINFPANPTTACITPAFFSEVIAIAKHYKVWVVHDFAYADIVFDGYKAPSILEVPGAKDIAVESFTLSKSYNMAGWRIGFLAGNPTLIHALKRIKSYIDYGIFAPIQLAAVTALDGPEDSVVKLCQLYQARRDFLCAGLTQAGFDIEVPKATMFVWVKIPDPYAIEGSLYFAQDLLRQTGVAVSPGICFGAEGDKYIRFSLILDEPEMKQALAKIQSYMQLKIPTKMECA